MISVSVRQAMLDFLFGLIFSQELKSLIVRGTIITYSWCAVQGGKSGRETHQMNGPKLPVSLKYRMAALVLKLNSQGPRIGWNPNLRYPPPKTWGFFP